MDVIVTYYPLYVNFIVSRYLVEEIKKVGISHKFREAVEGGRRERELPILKLKILPLSAASFANFPS